MKLKFNNTFILNLGWHHFVFFLTVDFEMSCNIITYCNNIIINMKLMSGKDQ